MNSKSVSYGGKANSLIKLKEKNFNIPKFFVIDSDTYKTFLEQNSLLEKITQCIQDKEISIIKDLIMNCEFSIEQKENIKSKFNELGLDLVSVRSSASNEDGKEKSFAGQYDTFLNVSYDNLEESIKKCWCSLYSENILEYEDKLNIYGMNVVVQQMINPEYAGVAFTIDPTTDTNNYSVIEMVQGLGAKLVSGEITPTKFLVRRETKNIDLVIGNIEIEESIIKELEKIILDIEKVYNVPMDIEYAICDNTIYILQARPITSITPLTKIYGTPLTRPQSIIENELYFEGEYLGIKNLTNGLYYFKPLFIYDADKSTVQIYYNDSDLEEDPTQMYHIMDKKFEDILEYNKKLEKDIENFNNILANNEKVDLDKIRELSINIQPFISLGQLAGCFERISPRLKELLINFRSKYDYIIHKIWEVILDEVESQLIGKYKEYIEYITYDEYKNRLPSIEELEKRKKGYIYLDKLYVTDDYEVWLKQNNIKIDSEEGGELLGQVAYPGYVKSKVCIIYSEADFVKFEDRDVIVTPMTVPKFVKIIKRASAIVTDEGGITCHASIVARELKIPCIVGCKSATKLLRDGDVIEIDGSTGQIRKV